MFTKLLLEITFGHIGVVSVWLSHKCCPLSKINGTDKDRITVSWGCGWEPGRLGLSKCGTN